MQRFDAEVLAYCLMGNHDHFVLHTRQANLSLLAVVELSRSHRPG